jgi:hypothetical protein
VTMHPNCGAFDVDDQARAGLEHSEDVYDIDDFVHVTDVFPAVVIVGKGP